jgi:hypothetical protein
MNSPGELIRSGRSCGLLRFIGRSRLLALKLLDDAGLQPLDLLAHGG